MFIPGFISSSLDGSPDHEIEYAQIVIHGENANANVYYCDGLLGAVRHCLCLVFPLPSWLRHCLSLRSYCLRG